MQSLADITFIIWVSVADKKSLRQNSGEGPGAEPPPPSTYGPGSRAENLFLFFKKLDTAKVKTVEKKTHMFANPPTEIPLGIRPEYEL